MLFASFSQRLIHHVLHNFITFPPERVVVGGGRGRGEDIVCGWRAHSLMMGRPGGVGWNIIEM